MTNDLPTYSAKDFDSKSLAECDAIMKGGVTSGIVYPYAILEIARRYRFRSLGGTSAGAIAAAFAAAAEYSRTVRGDPAGFVRLQSYCEQLPNILPDLFQADPEYQPAVALLKRISAVGLSNYLKGLALRALIAGAGGALIGWLIALAAQGGTAVQLLAAALGLLLGSLAFGGWMLARRLVRPVRDALVRLPGSGFGLCSGRTVGESRTLALTDWLHSALQDIAFASPNHPEPLTFGHLEAGEKPVLLRMITTNLSMGRPHTLPELGMTVGYLPADWAQLFPPAVMRHLKRLSRPWRRMQRARTVPQGSDLPVIVAMRMSLSFPLLFKAVPILVEDFEFRAVVRDLGGSPKRRICTAWLTDGGLSSNFPVHLFDAPLPTRPTFAISLDELQCDPAQVARRVLLPQKAISGIGVQVHEIRGLRDFGWQLLASAKDWQDQLSSEVTGQRERVARIYLGPDEGGLNLAMPAEVSRRLMRYGYEVGQLFISRFNFQEHKWRRLLAVHRTTTAWLDRGEEVWNGGFGQWYGSYRLKVQSYKRLTLADRAQIGSDVGGIFAASASRPLIAGPDSKFPKKTGQLRIAPRY